MLRGYLTTMLAAIGVAGGVLLAGTLCGCSEKGPAPRIQAGRPGPTAETKLECPACEAVFPFSEAKRVHGNQRAIVCPKCGKTVAATRARDS